MNIIPIGERVLVTPKEHEARTKGGIFIPESAQEQKKEGTVAAAGTFADGKPLPLKKGDRVLYGGYSHEDFEIDGVKYVIVEFKNIVAKLEELK